MCTVFYTDKKRSGGVLSQMSGKSCKYEVEGEIS